MNTRQMVDANKKQLSSAEKALEIGEGERSEVEGKSRKHERKSKYGT